MTSRKHTIVVYLAIPKLIDIFLNYITVKNVKFNILEINDKLDPPYVIIKTSRSKKELDNIIKKQFKNNFALR